MPLWFGHVNKRVFNPRELRKGIRPVMTHIGRVSGATHRTPLDAMPVDGGYLFILVYGSRSDWVRNVMTAGEATLTIEGADVELTSPVLLDTDEAWKLMPSTPKRPPRIPKIDEYLFMAAANR